MEVQKRLGASGLASSSTSLRTYKEESDQQFLVGSFAVTEAIYESRKTRIYRAHRVQDSNKNGEDGSANEELSKRALKDGEKINSYIIKTINADSPTIEALAPLRHEYRVLKLLRDVEGVVSVVALESFGKGLALVLRDFEGETLRSILRSKRIPLKEFLGLAIELAQTLGRIHERGVIHKDIKPDNINYNRKTGKVQIFDFGISSRLSNESCNRVVLARLRSEEEAAVVSGAGRRGSVPDISAGDKVKNKAKFHHNPRGTLAYMSPEQTGRMNRVVDFRSDFYSLGITFFEILAGHPPFYAHEPLEYIHQHLAKVPPRVEDAVASRYSSATSSISSSTPSSPFSSSFRTSISVPDLRAASDSPSPIQAILASAKEKFPDKKVVLPTPVGSIIAKLLAKTAEERYQSAEGLCADLRQCLDNLDFDSDGDFVDGKEEGRMKDFVVGQMDCHSQFLIPQKLYGRGKEVAQLMAAYERAATLGKKEAIFVRGYSGIGKSSIVNEVHKPIARSGGYFIGGKFDQFKRNTSFLMVAFSDLINQLLSEGKARVEGWKTKILEAVGTNGQVVIDILPELEKVIGTQPAIPELGPSEAQNRFNIVFLQFVRVFCQSESPLTLFLDDLQWADSTSLKLMSLLMCDSELKYLFFIGAYRDNEVEPTHPLMAVIKGFQESNVTVTDLEVKPLEVTHITELACDATRCSKEKGKELATLLHNKTAGNPFFVNQLLKTFYQDGLLKFDFASGCWDWRVNELEEMISSTSNVIDLMLHQINKLQPNAQRILKLAAAVGAKFALDVLATVAECSLTTVAADLWEALQAGLVLPMNTSYNMFVELEDLQHALNEKHQNGLRDAAASCMYRFLHDRVQQAAYSLIPEEERNLTHLRIGRLLWEHTPKEKLEEEIHSVVNQLNMGYHLITDPQERWKAAMLNFSAGKKACAATAYLAAVKYLDTAIYLIMGDFEEKEDNRATRIGLDCWDEAHRKDTMAIVLEATVAHYLNIDFTNAGKLCELMLQHATNNLERVLVYEIQMQFHIQQHQMQPALDIGLQALDMLGIPLIEERPPLPCPGKKEGGSALRKMSATKAKIRNKKVSTDGGVELLVSPPERKKSVTEIEKDYISSMKEMKDEEILAAMRILMNLCAPTYVLRPDLNMRVAFTMVDLTIKHGVSPIGAFGYGLYALVLFLFDLDEAHRAGRIGMQLLEKFRATPLTAKLYGLFYAHVDVWKNPLKTTLVPILHAIHSGLENGDLEWAGYCSFYYCDHLFFSGEVLETVFQTQEQYVNALLSRHQTLQATYLNMWRRLVEKIHRPIWQPVYSFGDKKQSDEDVLAALTAVGNKMFLFTFYLANGMLAFFREDFKEAIELLQKAKDNISGVVGMMTNAQHVFYSSLALLCRVWGKKHDKSSEKFMKLVATVKENQKLLHKYATHAPANYMHKYHLVKAMFQCMRGKHSQAMDMFDSAIEGASANGVTQDEALAKELAAEFYFKRGREKVGLDYLKESYYAYMKWGCVLKTQLLDTRMNNLPQRVLSTTSTSSSSWDHSSLSSTSSSPHVSLSSTLTTFSLSSEMLDLSTVVKASQALLGEIELDRLVEKLIHNLMENTGANKCVLLLQKDKQLYVNAVATIMDGPLSITMNTDVPVEKSDCCPISIVNFVTMTSDIVVRDNPYTEGPYMEDPYIVQNKPKCLMCVPIQHLSKLLGVLYLENSTVTGAFQSDRLWLVTMISSQMGTSLRNSFLFSELNHRTLELVQSNTRLEEELAERIKVQAELEEAMKLAQAAVKAKNQFLANMSHELRTPLNAIIGMTELLQDSPLTEEQEEWISLISISGNSLLSLVDDILDLAKMEHGKVQVLKEKFSLSVCMSDALKLFRHEAAKKHIQLDIAVPDMESENEKEKEEGKDSTKVVPDVIYTDPARLRQILLNLLSNAIKFTPWGGKVTVTLTNERVDLLSEETEGLKECIPSAMGKYDKLHFVVRDTGAGIPKELVTQLFQPFIQGDASFSRKTGGTGLGLAISKQLVELLNGTIWATNTEQGAEFHVTLFCEHVEQPSHSVFSKPVVQKRQKAHTHTHEDTPPGQPTQEQQQQQAPPQQPVVPNQQPAQQPQSQPQRTQQPQQPQQPPPPPPQLVLSPSAMSSTGGATTTTTTTTALDGTVTTITTVVAPDNVYTYTTVSRGPPSYPPPIPMLTPTPAPAPAPVYMPHTYPYPPSMPYPYMPPLPPLPHHQPAVPPHPSLPPVYWPSPPSVPVPSTSAPPHPIAPSPSTPASVVPSPSPHPVSVPFVASRHPPLPVQHRSINPPPPQRLNVTPPSPVNVNKVHPIAVPTPSPTSFSSQPAPKITTTPATAAEPQPKAQQPVEQQQKQHPQQQQQKPATAPVTQPAPTQSSEEKEIQKEPTPTPTPSKEKQDGTSTASPSSVVPALRVGSLPSHAPSPSAANETGEPSLRILVAEDNVANQKLLLQLLKRLHYVADLANDGAEALEAWRKNKYDVILMDLQMPNMDGLEATRHIMAESTEEEKPQVIAVTANVYDCDKENCAAVGMCNFIGKPIKIQLLKEALSKCTTPRTPKTTRN